MAFYMVGRRPTLSGVLLAAEPCILQWRVQVFVKGGGGRVPKRQIYKNFQTDKPKKPRGGDGDQSHRKGRSVGISN